MSGYKLCWKKFAVVLKNGGAGVEGQLDVFDCC